MAVSLSKQELAPHRPKLNDPGREHPDRATWIEFEERMRASFIADRRHLVKFLVPHLFEGGDDREPTTLNRSRFGHGIGLNKGYLFDLFGHVRTAPVTYRWGALGNKTDQDRTGEPEGDKARRLWHDADGRGTNWKNFIGRKVLEWMLSSVGGFVLIDGPEDPEAPDARPFAKFVPWSDVEDFSWDGKRFKWIKFVELEDVREPDSDRPPEKEGSKSIQPGITANKPSPEQEPAFAKRHILMELLEDGATVIGRYDEEGTLLGVASPGTLEDRDGKQTLPIVPVSFGEHPEFPWLGAGLLIGLEDIVIDLFNLVSEVRENYRDSCFSVVTYRGEAGDEVLERFKQGSRFIDLGGSAHNELERVGAEAAEVQAGLSLIEATLVDWMVSALRKAAEAVERSQARSGVALQAEFQLDMKPLLVEIAERLDEIENNALHLMAQMWGIEADRARDVLVTRNTNFRQEDEAERILRLGGEWSARFGLPAEAQTRLGLRFLEASKLLGDIDQPVGEDENGPTLRDLLEQQLRNRAEAEDRRAREGVFGLENLEQV